MINNAKLNLPGLKLLPFFLFALAASGLYASSLYSFLLFHSLIEVLYVLVLLIIFALVWNTRAILDNHSFLFLGISFLFTAAFSLIHMFAYKGFGVFPGENANLPTQLWIASRYLFSLSFLIAPVFITRHLNATVTLIVYTVLTVLLFTAIFSGVFPDCFIEGEGLTPFKVYSEYVIIVILMAALGILISKRVLFDPYVLKMLVFSIVSAAAADAAFTQYLSVYGPANLIGHFFLLLSAVLMYRAIVVTAIIEPRAIIYRNLEQSREQFKRIAETSVDLIFQLDVAGKVMFCSPAVVQCGFSVADVIGKNFGDFIAHDDLDLAVSTFEQAIGGEQINGLELRLVTANGSSFHAEINIAPLVVDGAVIGLQGVSRDVTSRKQVEEVLRESEERYRDLVQNANSAMIRWNRNGTISVFNEYAQGFFGYREEEIIGKHVSILVPQQDSTGIDLSELVQNIVDNPERYKNFENENVCRNGRRVWMSWTNKPIFDGDGNVIEILAIGNDITARKQMEELLQASVTRYRDLAESIPAMLWAANVQGVTVDHNRRWYEYSGQNAEQSRGDGWKEIVHPDDVQRVGDAWAHCIRTGEDYSIEYRLRRAADGIYRWHSVQARLRRDCRGNPLDWFGTCIDIDDRKRAEEALRASEERLRMVLEASSIGTFELNLQTGKGQWNSVEYELLGLKHEEVSALPEIFFQYVHPDDIKALKAEWEGAIQLGELDTEFRIVRADGHERWLAAKGRFLDDEDGRQSSRFLGVNFDITDRKLIEHKLRESEALYRGIGESIDYGVWVCAPDGRNTYASESFLKMVGITQDQCSNFGWGNVLHPDDAERTIAAWQECVHTGGTWDIEHRFHGKDGQWHHVLARGVPVRNEQGEIICWAGINLDISRLKQAEELVKASLAEKEVMLREIHHRVKNNLQVISSLISLQTDNLTDERTREEFNDVRDRVRAMALVHEKLYQTENLAQLNFAEYVTSLLHFLWRSHDALAEKVRLHLAVEPVTFPIEIAVPCGLILNELVGNALKHAFPDDKGGDVTVGLEHDPANEIVCLRVCDNGVGLRAGLDWRQVRSLGLRLVRILAGQLRGEVETGTGPGTEFKITFPLNRMRS